MKTEASLAFLKSKIKDVKNGVVGLGIIGALGVGIFFGIKLISGAIKKRADKKALEN